MMFWVLISWLNCYIMFRLLCYLIWLVFFLLSSNFRSSPSRAWACCSTPHYFMYYWQLTWIWQKWSAICFFHFPVLPKKRGTTRLPIYCLFTLWFSLGFHSMYYCVRCTFSSLLALSFVVDPKRNWFPWNIGAAFSLWQWLYHL